MSDNMARPSKTIISRRKFCGSAAGIASVLVLPSTLSDEKESGVDSFLQGVSGKSVLRTDEDYEELRKNQVWQMAKPDRKPDLIVQPASTDDIVKAVKFAGQEGLKVIAKSGGHSICGSFLRNSGMLLDMSRMNKVVVDAETKTVSVEPGTMGAALMHELQNHGLAFPLARGATVAVGGFLLGGGLGFNPNTWGIACQSIVAADVITADGQLISVDKDNYPDIYWAVRGAGPGFFGIVTQYRLQAHSLPGSIMTSQYIHPLTAQAKVGVALEKLVHGSDKKLELILLLTRNPDKAAVAKGGPAQVCLINVVAYGDNEDEAEKLLQTVSTSALNDNPYSKTEYTTTNLMTLTGETGSAFPSGRMATEGVWSNSIAPVISVLSERMQKAATPVTTISIRFMGNSHLAADMAYSIIGSTNILSVLTWLDEKEDTIVAEWLKGTMSALQPYSLGHYINNEDVVTYPERNQFSFSPVAWKRLKSLRKTYDPKGVFHNYYGVNS